MVSKAQFPLLIAKPAIRLRILNSRRAIRREKLVCARVFPTLQSDFSCCRTIATEFIAALLEKMTISFSSIVVEARIAFDHGLRFAESPRMVSFVTLFRVDLSEEQNCGHIWLGSWL